MNTSLNSNELTRKIVLLFALYLYSLLFGMPSTVQCPNSSYACFESFIELLLAAISFGVMFMALRAVMNDRNHTLVKIDKVVYTTATVAMAVMVVYFLAWGSKTLMLLNIFQLKTSPSPLSDASTFSSRHSSATSSAQQSSKKTTISTFGRLSGWHCSSLQSSGSGVLSCTTALTTAASFRFDCIQIDHLMLSATGLILSLIVLYLGFRSIQIIELYKEEKPERQLIQEGHDDLSTQALLEEMNNRTTQIHTLMISGVIQFGIQFLWDFVSHASSDDLSTCFQYYEATGVLSIIVFIFLKAVSLMTLPLTVYYIFYHANKHSISSLELNVQDLHYDHRSSFEEEQQENN